MLARLWQRINEALAYKRTGDIAFAEIKAIGDKVKVVITLDEVEATITLWLSPESAWLIGNKITDEVHVASKERAGDAP